MDTVIKDLEFSELMCAKFCHDLAGCLGAISNSIDFLDSKNEEMRTKSIDLVKFSSSQAISRVMFFRKAYGFVPQSSEISLSEIKSLIQSFLGGEKLNINFSDLWGSNMINSNLGKLILNTSLIVSTIVMHRGDLQIKIDKKFSKIEMNVPGSFKKINQDLLSILQGSGQSIEKNTRNVQHFYTYAVAKSINYAIDLSSESEGVSLIIAPKS